jgi:hypothetical protein
MRPGAQSGNAFGRVSEMDLERGRGGLTGMKLSDFGRKRFTAVAIQSFCAWGAIGLPWAPDASPAARKGPDRPPTG